MAQLSVNLNAVAQLRNRRNLPWPSVIEMARLRLGAGADGITVHPRPDERHIRKTDVFELVDLLRDEWPGKEFNIEGYPTEAFLKLCEVARPDQVTFVPDDPAQATSDHGWDIAKHGTMLAETIERMQGCNMRVALFVDADPKMPAMAAEVGRGPGRALHRAIWQSARRHVSRTGEAEGNRGGVPQGRAAGRARRGGARHECRARSDARESAGADAGDSRSRRVLDRPRADGGRAEIRIS